MATLLNAAVLILAAQPAAAAENKSQQSAHSEDRAATSRQGDDIQIIEGEDRTVYEYRNNGILLMIKVVPKRGRPYYMVPADGSPHYDGLDTKKNLYPQWILVQW